MFIELWKGLLDYYHDNNSATDIANAKLFINWAITDIANGFDWPFLRGNMSLDVSADGVYTIDRFQQLSAVAYVYGNTTVSADNGAIVTVHGKYVSENTYYNATDNLICSANISPYSASSDNYYHYIDHFIKPITTDSIVILSGVNTLVTLGANETCISNDVRKITSIIDPVNNKDATNLDYNTQSLGNPNASTSGSRGGYDIDYLNNIRFFNINSPRTYTINYQRNPKYLSENTDITEFPRWFYQDIIDYAYKVYGMRFQDEQDAWNGIQLKPVLLQEIIRKHANITTTSPDCIPEWFKRRV